MNIEELAKVPVPVRRWAVPRFNKETGRYDGYFPMKTHKFSTDGETTFLHITRTGLMKLPKVRVQHTNADKLITKFIREKAPMEPREVNVKFTHLKGRKSPSIELVFEVRASFPQYEIEISFTIGKVETFFEELIEYLNNLCGS